MEMGVNTEKDGLNYNKWQNNPGFNTGLQGQESSVWEAGKKTSTCLNDTNQYFLRTVISPETADLEQ